MATTQDGLEALVEAFEEAIKNKDPAHVKVCVILYFCLNPLDNFQSLADFLDFRSIHITFDPKDKRETSDAILPHDSNCDKRYDVLLKRSETIDPRLVTVGIGVPKGWKWNDLVRKYMNNRFFSEFIKKYDVKL
jgi:hypothetical protein